MCFLAKIIAALQVASWATFVWVMNLFWAPQTNTDMQLYTSVSARKNCLYHQDYTKAVEYYLHKTKISHLTKLKPGLKARERERLTIHVMKKNRCKRIKWRGICDGWVGEGDDRDDAFTRRDSSWGKAVRGCVVAVNEGWQLCMALTEFCKETTQIWIQMCKSVKTLAYNQYYNLWREFLTRLSFRDFHKMQFTEYNEREQNHNIIINILPVVP